MIELSTIRRATTIKRPEGLLLSDLRELVEATRGLNDNSAVELHAASGRHGETYKWLSVTLSIDGID